MLFVGNEFELINFKLLLYSAAWAVNLLIGMSHAIMATLLSYFPFSVLYLYLAGRSVRVDEKIFQVLNSGGVFHS